MSAQNRRHVRWYYRRMTLRHLRRWWRERCAGCGRRLYWSESAILLPGTGSFHYACDSAQHWRRVAEERFRVLDVVTDMWEVDGGTVQELLAIRARAELLDESNARTLGWRVFYDLQRHREQSREPA
jgi:hypothetical protein